jgi:hypothetical protein
MVARWVDIVNAYTRAVLPALTSIDVLASPTVPIAAPEIGSEVEGGVVGGCCGRTGELRQDINHYFALWTASPWPEALDRRMTR